MPESNLSDAYYTRFHIWQGLVRSAEIKDWTPDGLRSAADLGFSFIWGDGSDVFDEDKKEDDKQAKLDIDIDTDKVLKGQYL